MQIKYHELPIPTGWTKEKIGSRLKLNYGKSQATIKTDDGTIPIFGTGGLMGYGNRALTDGDSVLLGRKGTLGNPLYIEQPFWPVDTTYYTSDFDGSMKWFYYLAQTIGLSSLNEATGVPSLSRQTFYNVEVLFPPPEEQTAIVDILSTVDQAIAQTEALIAKQRRIKAGLLHDLLTRGIDEHGQLRHRSLPQVSLVAIAEINPPRSALGLHRDDPVSFIPMSDVSERARWVNQQSRPLREVVRGYTYFEENDVLIAKITPCAENGKGCLARGLVNGIGFGSTEFHVLRAKENADAAFIYQLSTYKAFRDQAAAQMTGSAGQQRVPESFLTNYRVASFSKEEQTRIAVVLQTADDNLTGEEDNLAKLNRLKAGLMQDLLSGRVSVAGMVATRPA